MDKGTQSSVTSREGRFSGENRRTQDNVASDVKQKTYAAAVQGTAQQTKHRLRRRGKRGNGPVRKEKRRARYMRASASQHAYAAEPQRDDDTGAETRHKQEQCLTVLLRQQNRLLKQVAAGMHSIQRAITRLGSETQVAHDAKVLVDERRREVDEEERRFVCVHCTVKVHGTCHDL